MQLRNGQRSLGTVVARNLNTVKVRRSKLLGFSLFCVCCTSLFFLVNLAASHLPSTQTHNTTNALNNHLHLHPTDALWQWPELHACAGGSVTQRSSCGALEQPAPLPQSTSRAPRCPAAAHMAIGTWGGVAAGPEQQRRWGPGGGRAEALPSPCCLGQRCVRRLGGALTGGREPSSPQAVGYYQLCVRAGVGPLCIYTMHHAPCPAPCAQPHPDPCRPLPSSHTPGISRWLTEDTFYNAEGRTLL